MIARRTSAAASALLVLGGVLGILAPHAAALPTTTLPTTVAPSAHSVPPAAPKPTSSADSPEAPDPHPPSGGIGPRGEAVGGPGLLSRRTVVPAGAPALPKDLTARAWVLVDLDAGTVIAARDPHGRYPAASIQKILTSVAVLPRLPGAKTVTVSRTAADTEGSHAGLVAGGRYTVDQLFEGLLLVSGNDAAAALAEAAGGRAPTVALMNRTALALGAYDTYVQTPSGLDGWRQLTSAYDMALFLRAALVQPRFVHYDSVLTAKLPAQRAQHQAAVTLDNQNAQFLTTVRGAIAAKTGFTDAAQHTFAGAVERDGHRYGVILMRAQRYPDDQWVQASRLVAWGARLRAGTPPVGSLAAVPVAARRTTAAGTRSATPRLGRPLAASGDGGSRLPAWLALGAGIALLVVGAAMAFGWRIRRP
jgi:D-alanyl-D-alanine carboxypeptidase (penicillin-binding protein 5/6)